jgi:hypothetical protein
LFDLRIVHYREGAIETGGGIVDKPVDGPMIFPDLTDQSRNLSDFSQIEWYKGQRPSAVAFSFLHSFSQLLRGFPSYSYNVVARACQPAGNAQT